MDDPGFYFGNAVPWFQPEAEPSVRLGWGDYSAGADFKTGYSRAAARWQRSRNMMCQMMSSLMRPTKAPLFERGLCLREANYSSNFPERAQVTGTEVHNIHSDIQIFSRPCALRSQPLPTARNRLMEREVFFLAIV